LAACALKVLLGVDFVVCLGAGWSLGIGAFCAKPIELKNKHAETIPQDASRTLTDVLNFFNMPEAP
jgi:hypothetical protein